MPRYSYKAKNLQGEEESGVLEAQDKSSLVRTLKKKGYFVVSVGEDAGGGQGEESESLDLETITAKLSSSLDFVRKLLGVSITEKLFFTRNLRVMIKTGVPLPRAFKILALQTKAKRFKDVLEQISEEIIKGQNLSESLGAFPDIFTPLYTETIKVGEETGKLEESLKVLAVQMEREHELRSKLKTAMVYPVMVLGVTALIGVVMMIFAIPKMKATFLELGVDLPVTTKFILGFADFLAKRWYLAILMVAGFVFILMLGLRTKKGGKLKSKLVLVMPVIAKIIKKTNSALALRMLSSLLKAGVPIVRALEIGAGTLTNFYFKESLLRAAEVVEKGKKVSDALKPYEDLYSPMVLQMLQIGEETGETSEISGKLADFYEEEVSQATEKLSSIIEPVLILFIGGIVGFFAVSMMQPMFTIMGGM